MTVSNVTSNPNASAADSAQNNALGSALTNKSGLDENAFLKLLVAQMKNQDPLKPMDNTDFVAQLAQFSNLEQVMGINSRLDTLAAQGRGLQNTQVSDLVGKTVTINGSSVSLDGSGSGATFGFQLGSTANDTSITVTNSAGNVVRTIDGGSRPAGLNKMAWDGKNDAGVLQPAGAYTVTVAAQNGVGGPIPVTQNGSGVVKSISFDSGTPTLELDNGLSAPVSDLLDIQSTPTTTSK